VYIPFPGRRQAIILIPLRRAPLFHGILCDHGGPLAGLVNRLFLDGTYCLPETGDKGEGKLLFVDMVGDIQARPVGMVLAFSRLHRFCSDFLPCG
jgi:hypothetical protein